MEVKGSDAATATSPRRPVRVWTDGCFDSMHFGHANALRQAKSLGDYLIVGVHSDAEIAKNKGPTVNNERERYAAVRACKWVDEVVENAPYVTQLALLNEHNVDFCVHGDDLVSSSDGVDCYHEVKAAGRYREVHRTTGVSTTDIVRRMLESTKGHFSPLPPDPHHLRPLSQGTNKHSPYTGVSKFIATSGVLRLFSETKEAQSTDKVVYVDGAFDLFHIGHINVLKKAKEAGDFLIVGVLDDDTVNRYKGANFPIMNLYERVLSVLACKYVDEVVIAAPEKVTADFMKSLNIKLVVHGQDSVAPCEDGSDPYQAARDAGAYLEVDSESTLTTTVLIDRIKEHRRLYEDRNARKEAKELKILQEHEAAAEAAKTEEK